MKPSLISAIATFSWRRQVSFFLFLTFMFFALPAAWAQNTKGDRPVGNQRQIKETKAKTIKRKDRGKNRDIANRRLRTRGQSSANRANAQYRQPATTTRRPGRGVERSAPPRGRTFTQSPREGRVRAWKGDVSGYPIKRVKPTGHDAARSNVYPQKGPYVRYAQKRPKAKPPVYKRTIKGKRFVEHKPRAQERAWTGGLDHGPIRNQSATGTTKNTYSQRGPYVSYYHRRAKTSTSSYSNRSQVSKVKRYSRAPRTGGSQLRFYPPSRTQSYVQRGRKNVYWGKYQKKEKAVTTDITGGPLRTRNYKSTPIGLVGRDTLEYFDRKPEEGRGRKAAPSGYRTTARASRGWKGDVAGWPVRSPRAQRDRSQKPIRATEPGIGASWLSKTFNKRFKGVRPKDRIPSTGEARYSGNLLQGRRGFSDGAAGYSGNIKGGRPGFNTAGAGYSGKIRRSAGFSSAGMGYSGNIKGGRTGFNTAGAGYSGKIRRSAGFSSSGAGYSGNIKRKDLRGISGEYIGYSGNVPRTALSEFSPGIYGYSGFIKRSQQKSFSSQGAGYSGNIKRGTRGMSPQGESYRGNLRRGGWFNTSYMGYSGNVPRSAAAKQFQTGGYGYQGSTKRGGGFSTQGEDGLGKTKYRYNKVFAFDGAGFSGSMRAKRPPKGGGSVKGFWNNDGSPLAKTPPASMGGAEFSGRTKAKRPSKGGGSVSGILWNNDESALGKNPPASMGGAEFSGRTKAKRPEKGGGSVSGVLWNNEESALAKSAPATADAPSGLQVRVKEGDYSRKKNASKNALPGIAPTRASVKASEYSRNMKMYWNYKHNPSSSRYALKTTAPGKAEARIRDYQGNTKMRKYAVSGMHPDAKFAHSEEDNVKGERGLLTNVKLFWEKMFKKGNTQPSSVKDKGKKLQYDKREKDLWAY